MTKDDAIAEAQWAKDNIRGSLMLPLRIVDRDGLVWFAVKTAYTDWEEFAEQFELVRVTALEQRDPQTGRVEDIELI